MAGPGAVEKASIDEAYVDVTALATALLGTGGFVEAGTGRAVRGWMGVGDPLAAQPAVPVGGGGGGGGLRIGARRFTDGSSSSASSVPLPVTTSPGYAAHAAAAGRAVWAQCARGRWAVIGREGREMAPRPERLSAFTAAAAAVAAGGDFELGDGVEGVVAGGALTAAAAAAFAVAAAPGVAADLSRVSEARGDAEEAAAAAEEAAALALSVGRGGGGATGNARAFAPLPWLQPAAADALVGALIPPEGPATALRPATSHHDALLAAGAVIASYLRWRLFTELGFTASVGVSDSVA